MIEELVTTDNKFLALQREADLIFNHEYLGFGIHKSECQVEIWMSIPTSLGSSCLVLFTDLGKGTSVTNASEQLVSEIYNKYLISNYKKERCVFSETYDRKQIDVIIPDWNNNVCERVTWKHLGMIIK